MIYEDTHFTAVHSDGSPSGYCDWDGICEGIEDMQKILDYRGIPLNVEELLVRMKHDGSQKSDGYGTRAMFEMVAEALTEFRHSIVFYGVNGYSFRVFSDDSPAVTGYVCLEDIADDHQPEDLV